MNRVSGLADKPRAIARAAAQREAAVSSPAHDEAGLPQEAVVDASARTHRLGKLVSRMHSAPAASVQKRQLDGIQASTRASALQARLQGLEGPAQKAAFITDGPAAEGQVSRDEFLDRLRTAVRAAADQELATIGQGTDDCPYIHKWFARYQDKDAAQITRAAALYAPDSQAATDVGSYIETIVDRVRRGLREHVASGSTEGVPPELMETEHAPTDFLHIALKQGAEVAQLGCLRAAGGGGPPPVAPPPANSAIAPGGNHYATAKPNFGAAGDTFRGFDILTIGHVAAGDFDVSSYDDGNEVGFWWIFNQAAGVHNATDMAIWHLCRFSATPTFEVKSIVNPNLEAVLENAYGMVPNPQVPSALIGNRAAVLGIAIGRLTTAGWVLPP